MIDSGNSAVIASTGTFSAIASAFVLQSMQNIIVWMFVMIAFIFCDLFAAIWKCYKVEEKIRLSKATRDTMAKIVIYNAFVVSMCFTSVASEMPEISRNACLLVCLIEFVSIMGNILKTHGIHVSLNDVLKLFLSKKLDVAKEELEDVIKNDNNNGRHN